MRSKVSSILGMFLFAGGHINQNPGLTQKPIYTPVFTHYLRSWLLGIPEIARYNVCKEWARARCTHEVPVYFSCHFTLRNNHHARAAGQTPGLCWMPYRLFEWTFLQSSRARSWTDTWAVLDAFSFARVDISADRHNTHTHLIFFFSFLFVQVLFVHATKR